VKRKSTTYKEFIVKTTPFHSDILSGLLWELDIQGIIEEEDHLKIYTTENSKISGKNIEFLIRKLVAQDLIQKYSVIENKIENKNWNEEWEKSINII
jgi:hypothetical protein